MIDCWGERGGEGEGRGGGGEGRGGGERKMVSKCLNDPSFKRK